MKTRKFKRPLPPINYEIKSVDQVIAAMKTGDRLRWVPRWQARCVDEPRSRMSLEHTRDLYLGRIRLSDYVAMDIAEECRAKPKSLRKMTCVESRATRIGTITLAAASKSAEPTETAAAPSSPSDEKAGRE